MKPSPTAAAPAVHPEGIHDEKSRILAPDSEGAHQRYDFEATPLLLPLHRKELNSLAQDAWFSLISSIILKVDSLGFLVWTLISPGSSLTSEEQTLRATWEAASQV